MCKALCWDTGALRRCGFCGCGTQNGRGRWVIPDRLQPSVVGLRIEEWVGCCERPEDSAADPGELQEGSPEEETFDKSSEV